MGKADATIYLEEYRKRKDGTCAIKIRITYDRKRRYYPTDFSLTPDEFNQVMHGKRRSAAQKKILIKLNHFLNKATDVIETLPIFTFDSFEENYFEHRNTKDSVSFAFDKYIDQLKVENRLGTAVTYVCAKNSIEKFKPKVTFAEITPAFLQKYERWMLKKNKSISTVGIYLRSLRAVYNAQNIDASLYPFGNGKKKYSIPASKNIKKALTVEEIARIYNYEAPAKSTEEMAKDYWLFLYLCNGMNVKDFCLLKWKNIEGDILTYKRAKSERTKRDQKDITISLKPETWDIIKKWGQPSISKDNYIFPHLLNGLSEVKKQKTYKQLTKTINKYMKRIDAELGINKNITTYFARHSFATVLKRSGAKTEMISELLGHSSLSVTENYLDSFEQKQIKKETDVLTAGFKKAN